jgi:hypothetical protein
MITLITMWRTRRERRRNQQLAETAKVVNITMRVQEFVDTLPPDSMTETRLILKQIRETLR